MVFSRQMIKSMAEIVGPANCLHKKEDILCYGYDTTPDAYYPDLVVFPTHAKQVAEVLKRAGEFGVTVTPRGAGSGMTGGSLPVAGGIVMAMTRFNRILAIDRDNLVGVAEPGVVTGEFQKAVEAEGLFYPPDPSSADFSTLGGNAAECAGGPRAVKYGVTRDYVLGLEVVLPTGEIITTGGQTAKGVVGYDLTRLIVGSEGTLGVITQLILRLVPLPSHVRTMTVAYDRMEVAAETVSEIIRQGIVPRSIEYMDNAAIRCAEGYMKAGLPVDADAILIIEVDGTENEVDRAVQRVVAVCEKSGAREIKTAQTAEEAKALWKARKSVSPALFTYGPDKINEDIVVPRSKIPDMVKKIRWISQETGLTMVSFGHAGDGNIHVNIMLDKKDRKQRKKADQAVEDLFDYTLALGGTISGEHGVGITKSAYMTKEISAASLDLMRRIKAAFDPAKILNPGKMRV
jgi:glycolate oxidase